MTGALAGAANGFFGAGGGLFLVPLFTKWCGMEEKQAFATSVAVIFPLCALSAAVYYVRGGLPVSSSLGYLLGGAVKFCVPFGAMTSLLASFAAAGTDTSLLRRLFGVLLLYIGAKELFTKRENPGTDPKPSSSNRVTRENHGGSPPRNP